MTTQSESKKKTNPLMALALLGLLLCVIAICVFAAVSWLFPPEPNTPEEYQQEYGGNVDVYQRLLTSTDCTLLQNEFNIADSNQNIGYMKAADQRMEETGCYSP